MADRTLSRGGAHDSGAHGDTRHQHVHRKRLVWLLGPAFVAAIAYVDPGNVAANLSAGAEYGYLLVWVLIAANLTAMIVQYLSAKLGLVTGESLPSILGARLRKPARRAFWLQAELVAAATDLAEVVGGAVALYILFDIPLVWGGMIIGAVSMLLLATADRAGQRWFEALVTALLVIITVGFTAGLLISDLDPAGMAQGMIPRFEDTRSLMLAAAILGATVMPHAIYLHSDLIRDRFGTGIPERTVARLLKASRWDVFLSLILAGGVNLAMLLLAAAALPGVEGTETIEGAHAAITGAMGPFIGVLFGIGLLASGLASTSVGSYAGASIMKGLLHVQIPLLWRRLTTLIPALVILALGIDPTFALVVSQVLLSIGIPAALIPLVIYTGRRSIMGRFANPLPLQAAAWVTTALIVALNAVLIVLVCLGYDV